MHGRPVAGCQPARPPPATPSSSLARCPSTSIRLELEAWAADLTNPTWPAYPIPPHTFAT